MLRLVNQMLDISKIEAGAMNVHMKQGNIISYIGYLTELFQSVALEKNIRLSYSSDKNEVEMDFDKDKLEHIISNLLANALKFTNEGGKIDVKIQTDEKASILTIQVIDTGIGIEPKHLPHIFERFYQIGNNKSY